MSIQYQTRLPSSLTPSELEALDSLRLDEDPPSDLARLLDAIREGCCDQHLSSRVVLALDGDTIIGWSAIELWKVRPASRRVFTLLNVFVAPGYRNRGVGSRLANAAYGLKPELTSDPLYVEEDSPHYAFYRRVLPQEAFASV